MKIPKIDVIEYALFDNHTGVLLDRGSHDNVMATLAYDIAITKRNLDDFELKMLHVKQVGIIKKNKLDKKLHEFVKNFREDDRT